jgi:hypothetical protein
MGSIFDAASSGKLRSNCFDNKTARGLVVAASRLRPTHDSVRVQTRSGQRYLPSRVRSARAVSSSPS